MSREDFRVVLTTAAKEMLRRIGRKYGKKTYEVLRDLVKGLGSEPEKQGLPLRAPLHGLYSLHYSHFRVIYRIENNEARVLVVAAGYHQTGSRDDIYRIIERLVESGALKLEDRQDAEER